MSATQEAIAASNGALIGYLPLGFPDVATSVEAAVALAEAGCTVLEMGIPYSDPGMDGPVIQQATQEVLDAGFQLSQAFEALQAITARTDVPVLVMTYWNPVLRWGVERFATALQQAGGAGLITPDLTPENAAEWIAVSDRLGLDRVFLAAPSSSDARLDAIITASRGFIYTVSTMGTTGARGDMDRAARSLAARIQERQAALGNDTPRCVGLGISKPEHVHDVLSYAEGAIVGSAFVTSLREGGVDGLRATATALAAGTLNGAA